MDRTRILFFGIIFTALVIVTAVVLVTGGGGGRETAVGLIGSEKAPFFEDERVQEALQRNGLEVQVQKAGSREIATSFNLAEYDFAFPAGIPAARKIQQETGVSQTYTPFFTPMAIASWKPLADLLVAQGIATDMGGYYLLDMDQFLQLMAAETRWQDLPGNSVFPVSRSILLTTTDARTSNSAAMYLALASYVANEDNIVESLAEAQPIMPLMADLFLRQGLRPNSSQEPFEDYLIKGMGHSPIVLIYESQFIAQAAQNRAAILPEMVLMYPVPTIFTEHVLIPFSESGQKLGELLQTDPELRRLAIEYGLRNDDLTYFREFTGQQNIALPDSIVSVIEPPDYEVLEGMIQAIEQQYEP